MNSDTCCLGQVFFIFHLKNISSIIYRSVGDNRPDVPLNLEINRLINFISHFQTK